jgi:hypothetical protein
MSQNFQGKVSARGKCWQHIRHIRYFCDIFNSVWDYNPKEDNLEDRALVLQELENALLDEALVTWFVFVFEFGELEVRQKFDSQIFGDKIRH